MPWHGQYMALLKGYSDIYYHMYCFFNLFLSSQIATHIVFFFPQTYYRILFKEKILIKLDSWSFYNSLRSTHNESTNLKHEAPALKPGHNFLLARLSGYILCHKSNLFSQPIRLPLILRECDAPTFCANDNSCFLSFHGFFSDSVFWNTIIND